MDLAIAQDAGEVGATSRFPFLNRQSTDNASAEVFADLFLNWILAPDSDDWSWIEQNMFGDPEAVNEQDFGAWGWADIAMDKSTDDPQWQYTGDEIVSRPNDSLIPYDEHLAQYYGIPNDQWNDLVYTK